MKNYYHHSDLLPHRTPEVSVPADYAHIDSAADIIRDAAQWGILDELRELLCRHCRATAGEKLRLARDLAYELAGANDRDRVIDVYLHASGVAEVGDVSLRSYADRHGCCHEQFRQEVLGMQMRLGLLAGAEPEFAVTNN